MDSQAPPLHYPNSSDSTAEIYRTRQNELYSPTLCNGYPLPAYAEEPEPPQYQDPPEDPDKARRRTKKILMIRVMTSIFIALIVSLIVAGAVTKVMQGKTKDRSEETEDDVRTITAESVATAERDLEDMTTQLATTPSDKKAATTSAEFQTFDCPCWSEAAAGGIPTSTSQPNLCDNTDDEDEPAGELFLMGVSRYSSPDCRLARASYRGAGDVVRYQCTLSCRDAELAVEEVDKILAGSWKGDLE